LTGRALFVDDLEFPNLLHAAFLRSTFAHGHIRGIDTAARGRGPEWLRSIRRLNLDRCIISHCCFRSPLD
jgi:CO/xanthine dehydrogenase Mo-binding subunit